MFAHEMSSTKATATSSIISSSVLRPRTGRAGGTTSAPRSRGLSTGCRARSRAMTVLMSASASATQTSGLQAADDAQVVATTAVGPLLRRLHQRNP